MSAAAKLFDYNDAGTACSRCGMMAKHDASYDCVLALSREVERAAIKRVRNPNPNSALFTIGHLRDFIAQLTP